MNAPWHVPGRGSHSTGDLRGAVGESRTLVREEERAKKDRRASCYSLPRLGAEACLQPTFAMARAARSPAKCSKTVTRSKIERPERGPPPKNRDFVLIQLLPRQTRDLLRGTLSVNNGSPKSSDCISLLVLPKLGCRSKQGEKLWNAGEWRPAGPVALARGCALADWLGLSRRDAHVRRRARLVPLTRSTRVALRHRNRRPRGCNQLSGLLIGQRSGLRLHESRYRRCSPDDRAPAQQRSWNRTARRKHLVRQCATTSSPSLQSHHRQTVVACATNGCDSMNVFAQGTET